jgi:hypothetical protein
MQVISVIARMPTSAKEELQADTTAGLVAAPAQPRFEGTLDRSHNVNAVLDLQPAGSSQPLGVPAATKQT